MNFVAHSASGLVDHERVYAERRGDGVHGALGEELRPEGVRRCLPDEDGDLLDGRPVAGRGVLIRAVGCHVRGFF